MTFMTLQGSFTSGELSPALSARIDLSKYGQGCRTLKNFLIQPHGGAVKRPGFLMLDSLPGEAVLFPFVFNCRQAYVLIFGEKWLRLATKDGMVLDPSGKPCQINSPYTLEQAKTLSCAQSGDVLFIACSGIVPYKLKRLAHAQWAFEPMKFDNPIGPPVWAGETWVPAQGYRVAYPSGTAYRPWEIPGTYMPIHEDLYEQYTYNAASTGIEFVNGAQKSDGSSSPAQIVTPYSYVVTAVNDNGEEGIASVPATLTGPSSNNWQAGDYMRLVWLPVPGAQEYRIYKSSFGGTPGYAASTTSTSWNDYNTAPVSTQTPPVWTDPFPGGDYPAVAGFFEQRLVLASTPKRPQTVWLSRSGDYGNFSASSPLQASDSIELTIASSEVSRINWLIALRSLVLGAEGMEWELSSSEGPFTAKTAKVTPQSYRGSAPLKALVVGNTVLHVTRSGREVRDLRYDLGSDSYNGADRTILAAHLLEGRHIVSWCHQPAPHGIVWMVRDDGVLLGMTFQAEHEIFAWHQHHSAGKFKSVCVLPDGRDDRLFTVAERSGGYFLEVMAEADSGVFLDSALCYDGPPVKELAGLQHLEGRKIWLAADGAAEAPRLVNQGRIALDAPASRVVAGLPYEADLETMPVEVNGENGHSVGRKKYINAVNVLFKDTVTAKAGCDFNRLENIKWRNREPYGHGIRPFSGTHRVVVPETARGTASVCIRSDSPLPMTVLAIMPELEVK